MMRETVVRVGTPVKMNGVLCEPSSIQAELPAVIILNSGLVHKIGTCRTSVQLARQLASVGICSLRFDFPGIGDSLPNSARRSHLKASALEIAEFMQWIEARTTINKFILFGLCSGADAGFVTAVSDRRVVGLAQIDPYLFKVNSWHFHHYLSRIFSPTVWKNFTVNVLARVRATHRELSSADTPLFENSEDARELLSRSVVEQGYSDIVARGVNIFVLITGGQYYTINKIEQFWKMFPAVDWRDQLCLNYYPETGHVLPELHGQKFMLRKMLEWVKSIT